MKLKTRWDPYWYEHMKPVDPNEFVLLWFDPGGAAAGWAMFGIHVRAFARPEAKILQNLLWWDCGEFTGTETAIIGRMVSTIEWCIARAKIANRLVPPTPGLVIGTEDFDLTQTIGSSENLLSPVRQNAVLEWECHKRGFIGFKYQNRNARMSITADRLNLYGFEGNWRTSGKGKDQFAAMQHGVVQLKSIKRQSISSPWKVQR